MIEVPPRTILVYADITCPGVDMEWEGEDGKGFPVNEDRPEICLESVQSAAS